jgi:DNA primase catalytic core
MSTAVEQIKERLNIEEIVGSYVKLEKAGKNMKAKCPFHNEKTPSFYVSPDRGSYYCFGCGAKGDIFSFVEQFEGLDFMGALKLLGDRAGVDITQGRGQGPAYAEAKSEKERLFAVMEEATKFFETALGFTSNLNGEKNPIIEGNTAYSMEANEAREYVQRRGITEKTVKDFRIGFVPNEWRLLYNHLQSKGYRDADIEKAGLAKRPEAGETAGSGATTTTAPKSLYDRFRGRVMFPISDSSGRVIAFSGRILSEKPNANGSIPAKYLNSPDTALFNKSTVLYGIDKAKQAIRERDYTILVEGQMDLVLSHQAGIKNTVAVSGTALADSLTSRENVVNNLGVVRRLSPKLILAFDSDSAGRKAALRSAQIALSVDMDVKIADLPEGKDPADLVLSDPESWKNVLREAKPVIEFLLDGILADVAAKRLDQRKIHTALREKIYPFIEILPSQTQQGYYVKMVREKALNNIETEQSVWDDLNKMRKTRLDAEKKTASGVINSQYAGQFAPSGQIPVQSATISATAELSRLDIISRKLFGLLAYLARENVFDVEGYNASIATIAGTDRYNNLIRDSESSKDELSLEAEIFFGTADDMRKNELVIRKTLDELVLNFEDDIVKGDLASAMSQLSKRKDDSQDDKDFELKINALIKKVAEIDKKRAHR